ncbi:MAG: FAD-dependent oxidoreductase [Bacteroidota bacterium]
METKQVDFIVVGQGIAGTLLTYFLQKNNQTVLVIDEEKEYTSSKVAAGIYNPIVFKRLVKSWRADELIPFLENFYTEFEKDLGVKFLNKKSIVKFFASHEEREFWQKKTKEQTGINYFGESNLAEYNPFIKNKEFGYALLNHTGNVDLPLLLNAFKDRLKQNNSFVAEKINYDDIVVETDSVKWKHYTAKKIIFCEGHNGINNPYTPFCKLKPVKGDVLILESNELNTVDIINKGVFVLPIGNGIFKTGSTYNWNYENDLPEEKGKEEVLAKLNQLISVNYSVLKHESGIRPSSFDRRPILGTHPQHNAVAVFNGLGTKGIMIGPFFAKQLAEHLLFEKKIDDEVNAKRFF